MPTLGRPSALVKGCQARGAWAQPDLLPRSWAWETENSEAFWQTGRGEGVGLCYIPWKAHACHPKARLSQVLSLTASLGVAFWMLKNTQSPMRGPGHEALPGGTL